MKIGALIVPTGIGASIGGFAGDASKWARKLANKCKLIVNPNVVNAACFSGITENMLYVEGYSLDQFFKKQCSLKSSKNNKIGVVFDKAIPQEIINVHINTINAIKTVYDIDIIYQVTDEEVGVEFFIDKSKVSCGNVSNLETIKSTAQQLITQGADAIAIVCLFPEEQGEDYSNGIGVDPVGGVEAIISHFISKELKVPTAHAPAFIDNSITSKIVDSRCSAEYITPTYLPCILIGLHNAPKIQEYSRKNICLEDVDFIAVPYNAIGSIPVLEMVKNKKTVYAIRENQTILDVTPQKLLQQCTVIESYEELLNII